ncbi:MAG: DoxX family protein [Acidobacteriota bacterium]|nr:DoxX family protein [Acidobacteriota bacterium]
MNSQSKGRRIAAWILTGLLTLVFVGSAIGKLVRAAPVVEGMEKYGLKDHMLLIGVGELLSALLFFIPLTNSLGLLLLSAYLGGAIVTHMQNGEPYLVPSILLILVWVAGYLRHPEVLQSFRSQKSSLS